MKLLFAGTPLFAQAILQSLIASEHEVLAVLSQPDKASGRGRKISAPPVKNTALEHNIPVLQPQSLGSDALLQSLASYQADAMIVVAYGMLLPQSVIDLFPKGCLNIHASLLPQWRGAAPIHRAIEAGDKETGISIMQMDAGLDTGDVLYQAPLRIESDDTTATLHDKLMALGKTALLKTLSQYDDIQPQPQSSNGVSYAKKITTKEAQLDCALTAAEIERKVRAFYPTPGCWCLFGSDRYKLLAVEAQNKVLAPNHIQVSDKALLIGCADGSIAVKTIQPPNLKAMPIDAFLRGNRVLPDRISTQ